MPYIIMYGGIWLFIDIDCLDRLKHAEVLEMFITLDRQLFIYHEKSKVLLFSVNYSFCLYQQSTYRLLILCYIIYTLN